MHPSKRQPPNSQHHPLFTKRNDVSTFVRSGPRDSCLELKFSFNVSSKSEPKTSRRIDYDGHDDNKLKTGRRRQKRYFLKFLPVKRWFLLAVGGVRYSQSFVASFGLQSADIEYEIGSLDAGAHLRVDNAAAHTGGITRFTNLKPKVQGF